MTRTGLAWLLVAVAAQGLALAVAAGGGATVRAEAPGAGSAAQGTPAAKCPDRARLRCLNVRVPIDRSGRVPGTVSLRVEVLRPSGASRGVMVMLAGGPGQPAAGMFRLGSRTASQTYEALFPGYTLVASDIRGTGRSGPLRCLAVTTWATCAKRLGPRRDLYGTADHAEDLEAVRSALGYRSIGLWGTSYGTRLALAYAVAHPDRVARLLLDSSTSLREPDPFGTRTFSGLADALRRLCAQGVCDEATPDFAGDFAAVANALAAKPVRGTVLRFAEDRKSVRMDQWTLLSFVLDVDLWAAAAAALPAATHAARHGDPGPLLRLVHLASSGASTRSAASVNSTLFVATTCRDGPLPWPRGTPVGARSKLVEAAVAAMPAGSWGPFGRWAAHGGVAQACFEWPGPAGGASIPSGPLPDVPVLVLSGDLDTLTSPVTAAAVASRFPHGRLLVVPGVGHGVLTTDPSGCAASAVRAWLSGRVVPKRCERADSFAVAPIPAFRKLDPAARKQPAGPIETLAVAARTLREAEATWQLMRVVDQNTGSGLAGGLIYVDSARQLFLSNYAIESGITLTGGVSVAREGRRYWFSARLRVRGDRATSGTLVLARDRLTGELGGKAVSVATVGHFGS